MITDQLSMRQQSYVQKISINLAKIKLFLNYRHLLAPKGRWLNRSEQVGWSNVLWLSDLRPLIV